MESVIWFLLLSFNFEPPYFKELADVDKIYVMGRFGAAYILLIHYEMQKLSAGQIRLKYPGLGMLSAFQYFL